MTDTTASHVESAAVHLNEDWVSAIIGVTIFVLALLGLSGVDLLGWAATTKIWTVPSAALAPIGKSYAALGGLPALVLTYLAFLGVLTGAAAVLGANVRRFALAFSAVFWLGYIAWIIGSYAHIAAATPADIAKTGVSWSLHLTPEGGLILALVAGLIVGNFFPNFATWLNEAIRPEFYVKTAIVILGGVIAITVAGKLNLASSVFLRSLAAIVEAYLIYWPVVYYISRKYFGFSREAAVPLASGISICGVAAAIATGSAIRARPQVAVLVSSLVVIFAVVELLLLPFLANTFLSHEPLVAASWLGLAVKTDGAAVAAGGIAESLISAKNAAAGIHYAPGWILGTTTTIKVFIDVFIGIWAFILAHIWTTYINPTTPGGKAKLSEIWERFPKFILGFILTFALGLVVTLSLGKGQALALKAVADEASVFRVLFFVLTFFSIGVLSDFRRLWADGLGKLAAVYVVSLFGFVIWVGLLISWLFFHGVKPPLAG
ncbi:putative sulfate exporter family transporter [Methylovirgula ligni]|nr:putative sulfate exporter family transporter [Methylovirgula ligni]QAY97253.1 putative sulfate exporter family transporter [Methylovirgula ligni]